MKLLSFITITANVTGVTAASKGTTASTVTTAGTITFTAKYVCNGKTVTTTADVNITQEANAVTSTAWNNPVVTLSPASLSFTSGASSQNITASATQSGVITYTSTSTASTSNSSFTWSWSANGTGFSVGNTGNVTSNTVSATANPSTSQRTGSVTANAAGAGSKSGSKSATLTQAGKEEAPTGPYYGSLNLDSVTLSCADVPAGGGTVTPSWAGTVYQYTYYLTPGGQETNTGWTNINSIVSVSWSPSSKSASSLGTTAKARTSLGDCTATFTGYNNQSASKSVTVYQQANSMTATTYGDVSVYLGNASDITGHTISADGESYTRYRFFASQDIRYYYTSGSYQDATTYDEQTAVTQYQVSSTNCTVSYVTSEFYYYEVNITIPPNTATTTKTLTITCNAFGQNGKVGTVTYTCTQEADVPPTPTGNSISFNFASTEDFGEFSMAVSGSGVYDEQTTTGISDSGDLGSMSIPDGASIYLGVKNGTSGTRSIAVDYTTSSPSYSFTSVSAGSWKWANVTQADGKTFYIQVM